MLNEPQQIYLDEKTFEIQEDVNFIYDYYFRDIIDDIHNKKLYSFPNDRFLYSEDLKSADCQKAHYIQSVEIILSTTANQSSYNPYKAIITITLSYSALKLLIDYNYDLEQLQQVLKLGNPKLNNVFYHEFEEGRVKAAITHELSHWINNCLYNQNIVQILDLARKEGNFRQPVNTTVMEIDAQIHGIKAVYNLYQKEWEQWSLLDLFFHYVPLHTILLSLQKNSDHLKSWLKTLISRMNRENLLGRNMKIEDVLSYLNEKYQKV